MPSPFGIRAEGDIGGESEPELQIGHHRGVGVGQIYLAVAADPETVIPVSVPVADEHLITRYPEEELNLTGPDSTIDRQRVGQVGKSVRRPVHAGRVRPVAVPVPEQGHVTWIAVEERVVGVAGTPDVPLAVRLDEQHLVVQRSRSSAAAHLAAILARPERIRVDVVGFQVAEREAIPMVDEDDRGGRQSMSRRLRATVEPAPVLHVTPLWVTCSRNIAERVPTDGRG